MIDGLQARVTEKFENVATTSAEDDGIRVDFERLAYAKLEGPIVILAYQADDKAHVSLTPCTPVYELSFITRKSRLKPSSGPSSWF